MNFEEILSFIFLYLHVIHHMIIFKSELDENRTPLLKSFGKDTLWLGLLMVGTVVMSEEVDISRVSTEM